MASSPMKKSKSSIPRFEARWEEELREEGFEGTEGALEVLLEGEPRVAIQVGKTKEGSELPAKPSFE